VSPELRLRELLDRLAAAEVRFVIVGGLAVNASAIRTFLAAGDRTLVATNLGPVDVLQGLPQIPPFSQLDAEAVAVDLGGTVVRVRSLETLLAMKRASDRPRDRDDLEALERPLTPRGGGAGRLTCQRARDAVALSLKSSRNASASRHACCSSIPVV
jgi:predicted nucleotidyltransferase